LTGFAVDQRVELVHQGVAHGIDEALHHAAVQRADQLGVRLGQLLERAVRERDDGGLAVVGTVSSRNLEGTIYALDRTISVNSTIGTLVVQTDSAILNAAGAALSTLGGQLQAALVNAIDNSISSTIDAALLGARGWIFP